MSERSPASFIRAAFMRQQPRRLEPGAHLGELERDRLVLGDRLAERLSLLAVAQRQLERALGDADAAGGDVDAAELERVHHLPEALADAVAAAEDVLVACTLKPSKTSSVDSTPL